MQMGSLKDRTIEALSQLEPRHLKVLGDGIHAFIGTRPDGEDALAAMNMRDAIQHAEKRQAEKLKPRNRRHSDAA